MKGDKTVRWQSAGLSDVGRVREKNEDTHLIDEALGLFVVADGMGGHAGGCVASRLAVETLAAWVGQRRAELQAAAAVSPLGDSPALSLLADGVRAASAAIFQTAQRDRSLYGMGTTVTCLLLAAGRGFVAHVGDSRCYLRRGQKLVQVTEDHSLVNEQIKAGLLAADDARVSQLKNVITRSVGVERDVAVDTYALDIVDQDRFILCSDGLSGFVDDIEIGVALSNFSVAEAAAHLVDLANIRGGEDNITVISLEVSDGAAQAQFAAPKAGVMTAG